MKVCIERYLGGKSEWRSGLRIVDLGAADVNGSYRSCFEGAPIEYVGVDLADGPGVDVVAEDPYHLPLPGEFADVVLSGQALEHSEFFWQAFAEMVRLLRPDGVLFLIVPSSGPIHRYPVDCYRFYPDSLEALARHSGCHLVDWWHDDRGPWNDLVGVFSKQPLEVQLGPRSDPEMPAALAFQTPSEDPNEERTAGSVSYLEILEQLHEVIRPNPYLEIGVRRGKSLKLARGRGIGVDPWPEVEPVSKNLTVYRRTSDWFFRLDAEDTLRTRPDLVFVDGMHLIENVLRDVMNVELYSHPGTVLVVDDVLPLHPTQALRTRRSQVWCGDVWKLPFILREFRPDLTLWTLDAFPTGLLMILGLDNSNRVLRDGYNFILRRFSEMDTTPPAEVLDRTSALPKLEGRHLLRLGEIRISKCDSFAEEVHPSSSAPVDEAPPPVEGRLLETRREAVGRPFKTPFSSEFLRDYQKGTLEYSYRGVRCLKSPLDLAIYLRLLWEERPATIFEIGSKDGGSAIFFRDMAATFGLDCGVVSIDISPPDPPPVGDIDFLTGDVEDLESTFRDHELFSRPKPWLVVEDSAHTFDACSAALHFFSRHLEKGEILVIEDGVLSDLGLEERYYGGPNRAVSEFLELEPSAFEVITEYTDMFGFNATYNPNGYLRRV